jgi:2-polyprenyl-3-methyl-5-hydroxy-6-metoxy-1,4-benzoquinol methylase
MDELWDDWNRGGGPRYPHNKVVQFLLRRYPDPSLRSSVDVLDLGCGSGVHMHFLSAEGFRAHGSDISPVGVQNTRDRLASAGLVPTNLRVGSVDRVDAEAASFDVVISVGVLECAGPERFVPALHEIARVLRPGGAAMLLFASERDFRVLGANPLRLHGFSDEEVRSALASLPQAEYRSLMDRLTSTYDGNESAQDEHIVTLQRLHT